MLLRTFKKDYHLNLVMFAVHHRYLSSLGLGTFLLEAFLLTVKHELRDQFLGFSEKEPLDKFLSKFLHGNDKYDCL